MFDTVRASAISIKPRKWDRAYNADKLESFFVEASREGPDLILATEGVLEGYVVMEIIEGRAEPEAMLKVAEPLDGPYVRRFRAAGEDARHMPGLRIRRARRGRGLQRRDIHRQRRRDTREVPQDAACRGHRPVVVLQQSGDYDPRLRHPRWPGRVSSSATTGGTRRSRGRSCSTARGCS